MSRYVDWLKEQLDKGLEIYIYTREKHFSDRMEHVVIPQVNVQGVCRNVRDCNNNTTLDLTSFTALGRNNDEYFLTNLADSLGLNGIRDFLSYTDELKECGAIKSALSHDCVLAIKKLENGKFSSSVVCVKNILPYERKGVAMGDTLEESLVKTGLIYNIEKNKEQIEYMQRGLDSLKNAENEVE